MDQFQRDWGLGYRGTGFEIGGVGCRVWGLGFGANEHSNDHSDKFAYFNIDTLEDQVIPSAHRDTSREFNVSKQKWSLC